jgi:hypothetical protein
MHKDNNKKKTRRIPKGVGGSVRGKNKALKVAKNNDSNVN